MKEAFAFVLNDTLYKVMMFFSNMDYYKMLFKINFNNMNIMLRIYMYLLGM
jgi:hypothetical protein